MRQELVDRGVIVEAGEIGGRRFAEGERIVLREASIENGIANGSRATILSVDQGAGSLTISIDDGGVVSLPREFATGVRDDEVEFVQGGYANTVHTSQGGTVKETIIVGAGQDFYRENLYVGASRARLATNMIAWDGSAPEYFAEDDLTVEERQQEVRNLLIDAIERTGAELSVTEQLEEAGELLETVERLQIEVDAEAQFYGDLTAEQEAALERAENERIDDSQDIEAWAVEQQRRSEAEELEKNQTVGQDATEAVKPAEGPDRKTIKEIYDYYTNEQQISRERALKRVTTLAEEYQATVRRAQALPGDVANEKLVEASADYVRAVMDAKPKWLENTLGPRPSDAGHGKRWDQLADHLAMQRVRQGITAGDELGFDLRDEKGLWDDIGVFHRAIGLEGPQRDQGQGYGNGM